MAQRGSLTSTLIYALPRLDGGVVRVIDGPDRGLERRLEAAPLVIGSAPECDLVLRDRKVSRRHCQVTLGLRGFSVVDLGSRNGTLFEGSRVVEMVVPPGAILEIGNTHIAVTAPGDGAALSPSRRASFGRLVGGSAAMRRVFALLERAAGCDATVLLGGETGVGKEVAAEALHAASARSHGPYAVFDCGAVVPTLLAAELFGHARGAFTGADSDRAGVVERSHGGTLFLDEIGELPPAMQTALLRLCDRRTITRIGSSKQIGVDVRLVAATRRNLADEVVAGTFREDLYYRLQVLPIVLPPLRARLEDLPALVAAILSDLGVKRPGPIAGSNLERLAGYPWPGNVRQLRNALERAVVRAGRAASFRELAIDLDAVEQAPVAAGGTFQEQRLAAVASFEREYLVRLMDESGWKVRRASRVSGIERSQLKRLLKKHGLNAGT